MPILIPFQGVDEDFGDLDSSVIPFDFRYLGNTFATPTVYTDHVPVHDRGDEMRAVELFAGAGGMSLGLKMAGFEIAEAYERDEAAIRAYRRNVGGRIVRRDLSDLLPVISDVLRLSPDLICGGPPCQDFSSAGKREEGKRAELTLAFVSIIAAARPEWLLMENVARALKSRAWGRARKVLKNAGYGLTEVVVDASFFKVAQTRCRLIVVGRLNERDGFLTSAIEGRKSDYQMSLRDLFGLSSPEALYFPARSSNRRSVFGADEPAPTIRERSCRPVPESYKPHPDDAAILENGYVFARPWSGGRSVRTLDEPYPTVTRTAGEKPGPKYRNSMHPQDLVRASDAAVLSLNQVGRVQGFPVWWRWKPDALEAAWLPARKKGEKRLPVSQMIANAVPPPLAMTLGEVILARSKGETIPAIEVDFDRWLKERKFTTTRSNNIRANINRARRMLGGRTFHEAAREIATIEAVDEFKAARKQVQTDLRSALRLYAEFQDQEHGKRDAEIAEAHEERERQWRRKLFAPMDVVLGAARFKEDHADDPLA